MSIYEYDEEGHMKVVREEGFQEGQALVLLPMIIKSQKGQVSRANSLRT